MTMVPLSHVCTLYLLPRHQSLAAVLGSQYSGSYVVPLPHILLNAGHRMGGRLVMLAIGACKEKQLQGPSAREEMNSLTCKSRPNPETNSINAGRGS